MQKEYTDRIFNKKMVFARFVILWCTFIFSLVVLLGIAVFLIDQENESFIILLFLPFMFIITGLTYRKLMVKRRFVINHQQITTNYSKKEETSLPFSKISEILKYREAVASTNTYRLIERKQVALAYREDSNSPWIPVPASLWEIESKESSEELINHIEQQFVKSHLDKAYQKLQSDQEIVFPFIYNIKTAKKLSAELYQASLSKLNSIHNKKAEKLFHKDQGFIRLRKDRLIFSERTVTLDKTDRIKFSPAIEKGKKAYPKEMAVTIKIYDQNGNEKISFKTLYVTNQALLKELLKKLISNCSEEV